MKANKCIKKKYQYEQTYFNIRNRYKRKKLTKQDIGNLLPSPLIK